MTSLGLEQIQKMILLVGAPVFIINSESLEILGANDPACEISGFSTEDLNSGQIKKIILNQFFDPSSWQFVKTAIDLCRTQDNHLREFNISLKHKSGSTCYVNLSIKKVKSSSGIFFIMTLEDLSELKNQEAERNQILMSAAKVSHLADMGKLAGGIAHELNNPLAVILGYSENIEAQAVENKMIPSDWLLKNLSPMQQSIHRMAKIIRKMLSLMKHEDLKKELLSTRKLIEDSLLVLNDAIKKSQITVSYEVEELALETDPTFFDQIMTNIVTNAIKAFSSNQSDKKILIKGIREQNQYVISIFNNGPQIPQNMRGSIFKPFFTTRSSEEGSGLGLFLCLNLVKSLGGNIDFESNEGGTTFFLKLPLIL